jgi:hypothetical protein
MAVSLPYDYGRPEVVLNMIQRQDPRDSERHVSTDINTGDSCPLHLGEPATLEMENSTGRHCALLDKCGVRYLLSTIH